MTDERIAAIVFGAALILFGIIGSIVSGKSLKSETNPSSKSGLRQVFFTSLGGVVLGFFMLVLGIWGN